MTQFLTQFILGQGQEIPLEIITSHTMVDAEVLAEALRQAAGRQVQISHSVRSHRAQWLQMATTAAQLNLLSRINSRNNSMERLLGMIDAMAMMYLSSHMTRLDSSHRVRACA